MPEKVFAAYGGTPFSFGPDYIIPKPFDSRVLLWVCPAVARAALETGVAREKINPDEYVATLEKRLGVRQSFVRSVKDKLEDAKAESPQDKSLRIVFPEGSNYRILKACDIIKREGMCEPILLGNSQRIKENIAKLGLTHLSAVEIITPSQASQRDAYSQEFWELRQRRGLTREQAFSLMKNENYFGSMMVRRNDADGLLSGVTQSYPDTIRPFLEVVGARKNMRIAGVYMMLFKDKIFFFADTTVNIEPTASDLADIAICAAEEAIFFDIEPKVAMLSFSNFGSNNHPLSLKVREAVRLVKLRRPDIAIDGEMQADTAVVPEVMEETFPFCDIKGGANVLVFPDLQSANICYKLMQRIGGAEAIGPILVGMNKPINVLQ
ncbi:MAG: NADP-dependent malic enzyme, partial [Proteobacteria bacterium]|nr:NADP-dependent malic enzyme [Pseudomonadota bacterium]